MKKKIEDSLGDLKDKVTSASEFQKIFDKALEDNPNPKAACYAPNEEAEKFWANLINNPFDEVENYCNENNLTIAELIAFHREYSKSKVKGLNRKLEGKEGTSTESKHLNWAEKNRNRKIGNV